jgi:NTP pyrophosphatase (non-canonical NTP hydrolase)
MSVSRLFSEVDRILDLAYTDPKPLSALGLKLFEEGGELAEAINYHEGFLQHKTMKEPLVAEIADVINVSLTILVKAYPEKSKPEVLDLLLEHMKIKSDKWENIVKFRETPLHPDAK